jgi:hypothetical protein
MQNIKVTAHNLRRVFQRLLEIYEPLRRGEEDRFNSFFHCVDSNMLKLHRKNGLLNSRRAREAVDLCLVKLDGYLNDIDYDVSELTNPQNIALARAIQMAYDPFVNPEMGAIIGEKLSDPAIKRRFFEVPFQCLYRLRDSIDFWIQRDGSDGYFNMVKDEIGASVAMDEKMEFFLRVSED